MTLSSYFWDRWLYFAGKLSWDITTTQVKPASGIAESSTSFGWSKGRKVTTAGWQVPLCDPIWHVISHSGVVISIINCHIRFNLLTSSNSPSTTPRDKPSSLIHLHWWFWQYINIVTYIHTYLLTYLQVKLNTFCHPSVLQQATDGSNSCKIHDFTVC